MTSPDIRKASAAERMTNGPCDACRRVRPLVYGLCETCYNVIDLRFDLAGAFHAPKMHGEV